MKKFEEEVKRPVIGIEQSSIKPSLGKAIEFYTGKVKEYHNAFNEMNKYIDGLEAQLDYYKKDKRFEVMAEEILSLKSQLEKQQPEIPEFVAEGIKSIPDHYTAFGAMLLVKEKIEITKGGDINSDWLPLYNWLFSNNEINSQDLFSQAWINGYTVAKEKRFYLKNKLTGLYLRSYTGMSMDDTTLRFEEVSDNRACGFGGVTQFTQQEIDSMETGSYEQILVEVEE